LGNELAGILLEERRVTQTYVVTATWARRHVHEILDRATAGETIIVTRYGKPVARIVLDGEYAQDSEIDEPSHFNGHEENA
jgi:hypothetical protein